MITFYLSPLLELYIVDTRGEKMKITCLERIRDVDVSVLESVGAHKKKDPGSRRGCTRCGRFGHRIESCKQSEEESGNLPLKLLHSTDIDEDEETKEGK